MTSQAQADPALVELVDDLAAGLSADDAVAAVTVVGSMTSGHRSATSDVDVFVFSETSSLPARRRLVRDHADPDHSVVTESGPFGEGDVWWHSGAGLWVDLMVWSPTWAEEQLDRCLDRHDASLGYTTAFWRSIVTGTPVHERGDWHPRLQERARSPYPEALVRAVVDLNLPWLSGHPFSFRNQVEKAVSRDDRLSVNHRVAAWLASYFDVVFAVNRVLHPGEKRMREIALAECSALPDGFEDDLDEVLTVRDPVPVLDHMVDRLRRTCPG